MDFCLSCGHFEWSHDQFKTILNLGPKLAKNGRKRPQMTKNGLNVWKVTAETISIGFLLLLQSFWVVTWPVYDKFEFGAKIGWKMAKNGRKRPQMAKNDLNVWKMTFETIAIEILPLSRSFWVVTWLVCDNFFTGPKMAKNDQKWPKMAPKWPKMMWLSEK